jgi:hypothetical protein
VCVDIDFGAELIDAAQAVLRPRRVGDRLLGDVAAVLVTDAGHRFRGVSIDTGSGTGFCAEHSAIAAMVTAGEYRIVAIVAVWRDEQARLYVLPPAAAVASSCGRWTRRTSTPRFCWESGGRRCCGTCFPSMTGQSPSH